MSRSRILALGCGLVAAAVWFGTQSLESITMADDAKTEPKLGHMVYFKLSDPSPANIQKLIDACKKQLTGHDGTEFFGVGTVSDLNREVNDRDWDVGLQLVFKNRAAHDKYQVHPRHEQFVAENRAAWKGVRVFDTDIR